MKLLDCTLRDGGYCINGNFPEELNTYLISFNQLPVDCLEEGYRSNPMKGYFGKYFYCPQHVLEKIKSISNKKIAVILNEKGVRAAHAFDLLNPVKDQVDMVRIAIDPKNFTRALTLAEEVKKMGFEVAFNVMYMSTWAEQKNFLNQVKEVHSLADYFYMVDSFGGVLPEDIKNIIGLVRSTTDVKLGFHGHNNLELALVNTLTAIEEGVEIVDATVTGMGRGAGNLKTELLLTVLSTKGKVNFSYNDLSRSVDSFTELQKHYEWGTNLPYMVSGANSLPQKQVMEWVSKRYYSFNSIIRALNNQSKGKEDNTKLPELNFIAEKKYETALIIGGGPNSVIHSKAIERFLKMRPNALVIHASSKNALSFRRISNPQYFCLVGNEGHRLEKVFGKKQITGKCILPPYPRTMGTYVPSSLENNAYELKEVNFTEKFQDSHTALALQSILELEIKEVYVTGYDGYSGNKIGQKEQELFLENRHLFSLIKKKGLVIKSLTSTLYKEFEEDSVYSKI